MSSITDNVVVSSRVRLARNFKNMPFPQRLDDENAIELIIKSAESAAKFKHSLTLMHNLNGIDRQALVERHLISPDLAKKDSGALILGDNEEIAVMINEEDHIRAQCIKNGYCLHECYNVINSYDDLLAASMPIAYDSEFGYLTACLTNVGTGMRASVMVFLPAMTFTDMIGSYVKIAESKGITVRGVYGERSDPNGCLYQLSNARSIGVSEQNLIESVEQVVEDLCASEQRIRRQLCHDQNIEFTDKAYRAYGILRYARMLTSNQFMELVAMLKFGMIMDILEFKDIKTLDKLIIDAQPANLLKIVKKSTLTPDERDVVRAALVRKTLEGLK